MRTHLEKTRERAAAGLNWTISLLSADEWLALDVKTNRLVERRHDDVLEEMLYCSVSVFLIQSRCLRHQQQAFRVKIAFRRRMRRVDQLVRGHTFREIASLACLMLTLVGSGDSLVTNLVEHTPEATRRPELLFVLARRFRSPSNGALPSYAGFETTHQFGCLTLVKQHRSEAVVSHLCWYSAMDGVILFYKFGADSGLEINACILWMNR